MTLFHGIILGVLQGIAEFLPISSSGHLVVAQRLFGLSEVPLLFDVFLHLATLLAVVLFFRKKLASLILSFFELFLPKGKKNETSEEDSKKVSDCMEKTRNPVEDRKYIIGIIAATVVTCGIGLITSKIVEEVPIRFVCVGFLITACFLVLSSLIAKKRPSFSSIKQDKAPTLLQSLIAGLAQGIGTLPGISRSGSTIAGSLLAGMSRETAGEFSFIISIPAIIGAFILELKDLGDVAQSCGAQPLIAGCAAAFCSGYLSLSWLMRLIKKGRLEWFALYLVPLGVLGILFLH